MKRIALTALFAAVLLTPLATAAHAQPTLVSMSTASDCAKLRQASKLVEGPAKKLLLATHAGNATKAMGDALAVNAQKAVDLLATIKAGDAKVPASGLLINYLQYTVAGPDPTQADLQGARPLGYNGTKALCGFYPYL